MQGDSDIDWKMAKKFNYQSPFDLSFDDIYRKISHGIQHQNFIQEQGSSGVSLDIYLKKKKNKKTIEFTNFQLKKWSVLSSQITIYFSMELFTNHYYFS